jgi:hypothetical protein
MASATNQQTSAIATAMQASKTTAGSIFTVVMYPTPLQLSQKAVTVGHRDVM